MIDEMNYYGKQKTPFLFIIDFDKKNPLIFPIKKIKSDFICYDINGIRNIPPPSNVKNVLSLTSDFISYKKYKKAFDIVKENQCEGNSYLVNLTFPTPIKINLSLEKIFLMAKAKYKILYKDQFVFFSPETFITIKNNLISTYPMKGTIDASIHDAKRKILESEKEYAEHVTIVDLLRNDLSLVSKNVKVEKFRYIDKIKNISGKELFQVSSKITGVLPPLYHQKIGSIIDKLLPAGSITGAPKKETIKIIKKAENYPRGYYTGICGYFDGYKLDSGVMIRYIEKTKNGFVFKSGGGITIYSDPFLEYKELCDKVYVPII